ncbi:MAG TPA: DNA-processing protein DprA [Candidatus Angelobacter sp.]|jgi:DNA processing protein|nr:DNA-processing protein DprA [Candidatus Angelobacter sp.]
MTLGPIRHIPRGATGWPPELEHLELSPPELWVLGDAIPAGPRVAVVGARVATHGGLQIARRLGADLAAAGIPVVSGMALGIDGAAHEGALDSGGPTVAVLGCGIDVCYPPSHRDLRDRIARGGCVVTEEPPGTVPAPWRFPRRNRIIAALATALVVVEASDRSGALSTARHAADLGRDVFAVPGSVLSDRSAGTNRLVRDGAIPLLETADLTAVGCLAEALEGIRGRARLAIPPPTFAGAPARRGDRRHHAANELPQEQAALLARIGADPVHPDRLAAALRLSPARLAAQLAGLELAGHVRSLPGGLVARDVPPQPGAHTAPAVPSRAGG